MRADYLITLLICGCTTAAATYGGDGDVRIVGYLTSWGKREFTREQVGARTTSDALV